jgi:hypothetical protein
MQIPCSLICKIKTTGQVFFFNMQQFFNLQQFLKVLIALSKRFTLMVVL